MGQSAIVCMIACIALNWGAMLITSIIIVNNEKKSQKKELT